jgi:hypothetical protein
MKSLIFTAESIRGLQRACRWATRFNLFQAGAIGAVAARNWRLNR